MSVIRWTPRRVSNPFEEMERAFDTVFPSFFSPTRREGWFPAVEVRETAKAVEVAAELPGLTEKDLTVDVKENVLTLKGEKKHAREEKDKQENIYYAERQYGSFERSISLPAYVQADKAKASFKNGVVTVTLPKREDETGRRIDVTVE